MKNDFNIDNLILDLFSPDTLKDVFEKRLTELKISTTTASEILDIDYRAMINIIHGTKKIADFTNLIKIANFLQLSTSEVARLYINTLEKNFPEQSIISPEEIKFIKENFDLAALKKAKFIKSITDFNEINTKLTKALGLRSILDYQKPSGDVAFSAGKRKPKTENNRSQWIAFAKETFEEIHNEHDYDRKELVEYFPKIRWHCTNIEFGLPSVIKDLFKMGVTVIYQEALPALHLRGATFAVYDKPCVVLTNYRGFYPTLFFALIHELFHVLFDWEEIKVNGYHLSDDDENELSVKAKEDEADSFAREYLFSKEKTKFLKPYLNNNPAFVEKFTTDNHVHPSFAYVFNAFDLGKTHRWAWALANSFNPKNEMEVLLGKLRNPWENLQPVKEHARYLKNIFNY
ncbi:ImmA/IrrE family metallo-endopeptidase [Niastella sp. OAS944]|uniref:ImmA/IrrE family metallo-endopeptidase n=1 Tax=Niastella sp. OAS944 TaxID=2664089 RepID=UPI0035C83790|nr:Zn-dependent peptidase ImmA (M78 family) [Chitinophagaceae bacterium OAS944]